MSKCIYSKAQAVLQLFSQKIYFPNQTSSQLIGNLKQTGNKNADQKKIAKQLQKNHENGQNVKYDKYWRRERALFMKKEQKLKYEMNKLQNELHRKEEQLYNVRKWLDEIEKRCTS